MSPARIVFITHRFRHHATPSGYDRLRERIPSEVVTADRLLRLCRPIPERVFSWIRQRAGLETYTRERSLQELAASVPFLFRSRRVFHFLHADYGYRFLGALPNFHDHRIVGTFHRPPSVLPQTIRNPAHLSRLDRAIILGESQRGYFRRYLDDAKITCVPYLVDTDFFTPGESGAQELRCLFVGNYLRDFELYRTTVRLLAAREPNLRFTVVARSHFFHEFKSLPNTEIRSGLSDVELRQCYRTSSLLLLPLRDAVANTTILEAMACGLPVVTTDVGSVGQYLGPEAGQIVPPGNAEELADATLRLLKDAGSRTRASEAARQIAVSRFALPVIAARIQQVLDEVASDPRGARA